MDLTRSIAEQESERRGEDHRTRSEVEDLVDAQAAFLALEDGTDGADFTHQHRSSEEPVEEDLQVR
jgi:hypothetical protein